MSNTLQEVGQKVHFCRDKVSISSSGTQFAEYGVNAGTKAKAGVKV